MEDGKNKQNADTNASNAERDQDEGSMNNGTLGGNLGEIGSSNEDKPESAAATDSKSAEKSNEDSANKQNGNNK